MSLNAGIMGQRIRAARKMRYMSAEELAEKVDFAVESIGHIECGSRKPSLQTLYNIAEVLDVSLDYLTGRIPTASETVIHNCAEDYNLTDEREKTLIELTRSMIPIIQKKI